MKAWKRNVVAVGLLMLLTGGAFFWLTLRLPGAGAVFQDSPDRVVAGQVFEINVRAATWGSGGGAHQRYRDMRLQLLLNGQALGPEVAPTKTSREGDRTRFVFQLQAPVRNTMGADLDNTAVLRWQLRFSFDGQPQEVAGTRPILIDP